MAALAPPTPATLSSAELTHRLVELAGEEREVQVEFLHHLDELDRRRAWLELGFGSLWTYCLEALHLSEGAAGRRIGAMRLLRRFPRLAPELREWRLNLSTVGLLGPVLTEENLDALVARAAFKSRADTELLVASLQPRQAPANGIRRLPNVRQPANEPALSLTSTAAPGTPVEVPAVEPASIAAAATAGTGSVDAPVPFALALPSRPELRPVAQDAFSLSALGPRPRVPPDGRVDRSADTPTCDRSDRPLKRRRHGACLVAAP